jgi:hypothetical protein
VVEEVAEGEGALGAGAEALEVEEVVEAVARGMGMVARGVGVVAVARAEDEEVEEVTAVQAGMEEAWEDWAGWEGLYAATPKWTRGA